MSTLKLQMGHALDSSSKNAEDAQAGSSTDACGLAQPIANACGGIVGGKLFDSPWDIGTSTSPLRQDLGMEPTDLQWKHWLEHEVHERVQQTNTPAIPKKQVYELVCRPEACRSDPAWASAALLLESMRRMQPRLMQAFAFVLGRLHPRFACAALTVLVKAKPWRLVFLPLVPHHDTTMIDLKQHVNLPWWLRFSIKHHDSVESGFFEFVTDDVFMMRLSVHLRDGDTVRAHALTFAPDSLNSLRVAAVGPPIQLRTRGVLADMADIADEDNTTHPLYDMRETDPEDKKAKAKEKLLQKRLGIEIHSDSESSASDLEPPEEIKALKRVIKETQARLNAARVRRSTSDNMFGKFQLAPVSRAGVQIGWGIVCGLHTDNDGCCTPCKKQLPYGTGLRGQPILTCEKRVQSV